MPPRRGIAADIPELRKFMRDLKKVSPALAKELRKSFRGSAKKVSDQARRNAPRKTGKLARSITPRVSSAGVAAVVAKAPHARITEFGGRHPVFGNKEKWVEHQAHPYLFSAAEQHRGEFLRQADLAVKKAAREAGFR
jgi:hypothetical protein